MKRIMPIGSASLAAAGLLLSAGSFAQTTTVTAELPPKSEATQRIKGEQLKAIKDVGRLALTSCNVLFGVQTTADASTQRGFGDSSQRIDARVSVYYSLQGIDDAAFQQLADAICRDASATLASAGYQMVGDDEMAAAAEFTALHQSGKPTPYALERGASSYRLFAPAGQQVIDPYYMGKADSMLGSFKAMSTDGPMFREARLMKALGASGAHLNLLVDFAEPRSNSAKGFLGRLSGNDVAKVEAKLQLSVTGFMTMVPEYRIDSSSGFCQGANDARLVARLSSSDPLLADANAVQSIVDVQSKGEKAGLTAVNMLAGAMALAGHSTSTTSVTRNGVVLDPVIYADEVRRLAQRFVADAAVAARP